MAKASSSCNQVQDDTNRVLMQCYNVGCFDLLCRGQDLAGAEMRTSAIAAPLGGMSQSMHLFSSGDAVIWACMFECKTSLD